MKFVIEKTIDNLGRIVLPKSIREYYGISLNSKLTIIPTEEGILIKKADICEDADDSAESSNR